MALIVGGIEFAHVGMPAHRDHLVVKEGRQGRIPPSARVFVAVRVEVQIVDAGPDAPERLVGIAGPLATTRHHAMSVQVLAVLIPRWILSPAHKKPSIRQMGMSGAEHVGVGQFCTRCFTIAVARQKVGSRL